MTVTVAVANYYVGRAQAAGVPDLNPVKLHDLLYFAQGWHLGQTGQPLLSSALMAYRDGVYVRELRDEGCWGTRRIEEPLSVFRASDTARGMMSQETPRLAPADAALPVLERVWDAYGRLTPYESASRVREPGAPWDRIWNDPSRHGDDPLEIPLTMMRQWFEAEFKLRMGRVDAPPASPGSADDLETTQRVFRDPAGQTLRPM